MLKQRILTALILIPIFLYLLLQLPPKGFFVLTGILVVVSAWEWSFLMGLKKFPQTIIYPFLMIFLMIDISFLMAHEYLSVYTILYAGFISWLIAALLVLRYPNGAVIWGKSVVFRGLIGILTLIPCWIALNFLRILPHGLPLLLLLFCLIWGADIGAYFVGKKYGKYKLLPLVSPGKTWEGLMGALIATIGICLVAAFILNIPRSQWIIFILFSEIVVIFSVLGDLFESMLKRNEGLKDSSQLLPGHGGLLDRIDSLTAAAPVFALGVILLG